MKKIILKSTTIVLVAFTLIATGFFTACSSDTPTPTASANLTELNTLIDSCETILNNATTDDYPQSAITTFQTTLNDVKTAIEDTTSLTQTAVDNLVTQLKAAKTTFLSSELNTIPDDALIMGISFDETVTNNEFTTEGLGWTAQLKKGPSEIFGTATNYPSTVTGMDGNAMYFSNGAHLEISDYTATALEGISKLSVAAWVKPDSTRAGNYIISYNYWYSWKLNLQLQNRAFFTVHTAAGGTDADNQKDLSVPNGKWTYIVVSLDLDAGTETFYINGKKSYQWTAKEYTKLTGTISSYSDANSPLPLMVGACTTYAEATTWSWFSNNGPDGWDSFIGSIDELDVYNVALDAGQVAKLYKTKGGE